MIFYQRGDLKVNLPTIRITSLQLLKRIKVISPEDNLKLGENLRVLQIILNNLIRKKV